MVRRENTQRGNIEERKENCEKEEGRKRERTRKEAEEEVVEQ